MIDLGFTNFTILWSCDFNWIGSAYYLNKCYMLAEFWFDLRQCSRLYVAHIHEWDIHVFPH